MKESISGTALFMIVIFFVVIFTGYLCLSINQSRAFSVKNSIVRIVERYGNGINSEEALITNPESGTKFTTDVVSELQNVGYRTTGTCNTATDTGWIAFNITGSGAGLGLAPGGDEGVFCIKYVSSATGAADHTPNSRLHYFKVKTFYHFDIPVFRNLFRMTVEGNTKSMQ